MKLEGQNKPKSAKILKVERGLERVTAILDGKPLAPADVDGIQEKGRYKDYLPKDRATLLAKLREWEDSTIPEDQWDPRIIRFKRVYEEYLESDEDNIDIFKHN